MYVKWLSYFEETCMPQWVWLVMWQSCGGSEKLCGVVELLWGDMHAPNGQYHISEWCVRYYHNAHTDYDV